jgi:hypothetical protein
VEEKICVNTAEINLGLSSNRESKKKTEWLKVALIGAGNYTSFTCRYFRE